jgi:hypothetical protein
VIPTRRHLGMYDLVYLSLGIGGFAACLGYVLLCEKL